MYFDGIMDISHLNDIDLAAAKAAGIAAVIHKATEGATFQDPMYAARRTEAAQLGLLWGAYHFGTAAPVDQQISNFLATAQPAPNDVVVLDYEVLAGDQMTLAQAGEFVTMYRQSKGRDPLIYGSSLLFDAGKGSTLANCRLWIAQYAAESQPSLPAGFTTWTLWQFTDGTSPSPLQTAGVTVDRDRFNGTQAELMAAWPFAS